MKDVTEFKENDKTLLREKFKNTYINGGMYYICVLKGLIL